VKNLSELKVIIYASNFNIWINFTSSGWELRNEI
jgi:hypothetical protein